MSRAACLSTGLAMLAGLMLLGHASAQAQPRGRDPAPFASPGKVVAAEIALGQLARAKGQWKAFRETSADGAIVYAPRPVDARQWLKSQPEPAAAMTWQAQAVFLSCDGSLAVASGPWQAASGGQGTFATVWQRQKKGDYRWVLTQATGVAPAPGASDMIRSSVATCPRPARVPGKSAAAVAPETFPAGTRGGNSTDGTLRWTMTLASDCSRTLSVSLSRGAGKPMEPVLEQRVPAPANAMGCTPS